ncbi:uncharacterized protein LOC144145877 [Haemaphysalis longicornis]
MVFRHGMERGDERRSESDEEPTSGRQSRETANHETPPVFASELEKSSNWTSFRGPSCTKASGSPASWRLSLYGSRPSQLAAGLRPAGCRPEVMPASPPVTSKSAATVGQRSTVGPSLAFLTPCQNPAHHRHDVFRVLDAAAASHVPGRVDFFQGLQLGLLAGEAGHVVLAASAPPCAGSGGPAAPSGTSGPRATAAHARRDSPVGSA